MRRFINSQLLVKILILLLPLGQQAGTFKVTGPCSIDPKINIQVEFENTESLGALTIATLDKLQIPYVGYDSGMSSIFNTPIGLGALEVINDQYMRSYGWCYELDGFQPAVMPDQIQLNINNELVHWFFAYSTYDRGVWKDYCTPSHTLKPEFLCSVE